MINERMYYAKMMKQMIVSRLRLGSSGFAADLGRGASIHRWLDV